MAICAGERGSPIGGIVFAATRLISLLSADLPGRITGPDLPPFKAASPSSRRSPAICCPEPWHAEQRLVRIGSTSFEKSTGWVDGAGRPWPNKEHVPAAARIHAKLRM